MKYFSPDIPEIYKLPEFIYPKYSRHAIAAALTDVVKFKLPEVICFSSFELYCVRDEGGKVVFHTRGRFDWRYNINYIFDTRNYYIITVFLKRKKK